jgi:hypothetical protein
MNKFVIIRVKQSSKDVDASNDIRASVLVTDVDIIDKDLNLEEAEAKMEAITKEVADMKADIAAYNELYRKHGSEGKEVNDWKRSLKDKYKDQGIGLYGNAYKAQLDLSRAIEDKSGDYIILPGIFYKIEQY